MSQELYLKLLGGLEITLDDQPVTGFISSKAQALLCYLAVTGRPHLRPALTALLWGDTAEADAKTSLRMVLSNLRKLVGPYVVITRQTVAFNEAGHYRLDVEEFERHAYPVTALTDDELTPENLALLQAAVDLYRGDFLAGFHVRDALAFEEWVLGRQTQLRETAYQVLYTLTGHYAGQREYSAGIDCATRLLVLDSWREEAHRQLMLLLARDGQYNAALAQYETCRRILAAELNVEPMTETTALYHRIRAARATRSYNLPSQSTMFIGREDELVHLIRLLANPVCRLIDITGPGGIGKTRLAVQAAAAVSDDFLNGVYFVSLAAVSAPEFLASAVADVLDVPFQRGKKPWQQLLDFLEDKEMLLVLDNFEHLLTSAPEGTKEGVAFLLDLLDHAPHIKLLVTSRERLNLHREWVFELSGLAFPAQGGDKLEAHKLSELESYTAVKLFIHTARRIQANFSPSPAETQAIVDICRLVEGMPLGLELAAAWIRTLSCTEIAAEIDQNLNFLTTSLRDIPRRHRSLSVVFAHSWQLLSEAERRVFRRLSIFRGGFSREAARQVAGASPLLLSALVDKSLLRRNARGQYEIHELLRQYTLEKLQALPLENYEAQSRHAGYYAAFLRQREAHLKSCKQLEALSEIRTQRANIRLAWQWAIEQDQLEVIEQSLECLYCYYELCGRFQEGEMLFQKAISGLTERQKAGARPTNGWQKDGIVTAVAQEEGDSLEARQKDKILADILACRGGLLDRLGLYEQAQELLHQSLAMFEQLDAHSERAFALYHLGYIAFVLGEYETAKDFTEESLASFRAGDDFWSIGPVLNVLGDVFVALGDVEQAQRAFEESLDIATRLGLSVGLGWAHQGLGDTSRLLRDYRTSKTHYEQALLLFTESDAREGMAWALHGLGDLAREQKAYPQAQEYHRQSLVLFEKIGDLNAMSETLNALGNTLCSLAEYAQARVYFQQALQVALSVQAIPVALDVLVGLARILAEEGASQQALELLAISLHHPGSEQETLDKAALLWSKFTAKFTPGFVMAAQAHHGLPTLEEIAVEMCCSG